MRLCENIYNVKFDNGEILVDYSIKYFVDLSKKSQSCGFRIDVNDIEVPDYLFENKEKSSIKYAKFRKNPPNYRGVNLKFTNTQDKDSDIRLSEDSHFHLVEICFFIGENKSTFYEFNRGLYPGNLAELLDELSDLLKDKKIEKIEVKDILRNLFLRSLYFDSIEDQVLLINEAFAKFFNTQNRNTLSNYELERLLQRVERKYYG